MKKDLVVGGALGAAAGNSGDAKNRWRWRHTECRW